MKYITPAESSSSIEYIPSSLEDPRVGVVRVAGGLVNKLQGEGVVRVQPQGRVLQDAGWAGGD